VLLLSGGLDSAVALWWARAEGYEVLPLTYHYYRRPRAEVAAMRRQLDRLSISPLREIDLPFLKDIEDLQRTEKEVSPLLAKSPDGYIPARNMVFYALAAYQAEVEGATWVIGGHNGGDPETFPDSSPRFFNRLNDLYRLGIWSYGTSPVRVIQPLSGKDKATVVRLGAELGVPFEDTWSCYWDGEEHCGSCPSCLERQEAFGKDGTTDRVRFRRVRAERPVADAKPL